jgi:probable addiction module antidote protein
MGMRSVSYREDLMKALKDPAERVAYLNAALEDGDSRILLKALRDVADANGGIGTLASQTHLARESLYRMLSHKGNPELGSLEKILHSFGLKLSVQLERTC